MGKGDPKKLRGKMLSYAFFVQTCLEEHKKQHPFVSVNFSEFSKRCSERWKTMSAKEKGKFEDMAKTDKAHYEREMKTYILLKGETKKKFQDPNAPKRPPSALFLFCSNIAQKPKESILAWWCFKEAEWCGITLLQMTNSLMEKKAAKLKEKYEKGIAEYLAKVKLDKAKKGVVKAEKCKKKKKKKKEEEEDEEDEEEEEEGEEEEDDDA